MSFPNIPNFTKFNPGQIRSLSSKEIEDSLKDLVQQEREILHLILRFILEVDRRRLYLERARSSLFEYLTRDLGYSPAAAMRRIGAARLLRDLPEIGEKLQKGKVNLSQLSEISRGIKEREARYPEPVGTEEKRKILESVQNKNIAETQQIVALTLQIAPRKSEPLRVQADESILLQLNLSKKQFQKLHESRSQASHILWQSNKTTSWGDVVELLSDFFLEKKIIGASAFPRSKIKLLLEKSNGRCQYVDKTTGHICSSNYQLQIDHIHPKWAGGSDDISNLQLLCASHNRHKYEREAGITRK